jgi:putative endonuclease|tara:strand:- start:1255 stop:1542 length:288 start_codon:yes stop_codon:yes gene_type:complete
MNHYYVYILTSKKNSVLYIGFTNDLSRRMKEHKSKVIKGFTSKYNVEKLVYFEEYGNSNDAFLRERQLKKWKRLWKIELFEKENPEWNDLSKDWE